MRTKPEILAPAGSIQGLKAAVAAGCDAIYIGGSYFGARAYADNPKEDEMLEAIRFCHLHNVKIYMTVNTILKTREMQESLFDYLCPYYEAGLDAVIVQDVGVLRFVKKHFPKLLVHASTQMTLTLGKGTDLLKKYHVNRMVPARELTLEELRQMRKDTDLELEVFVHGALCYCYSGQCLFSSMLGGRSGNRGRCAQPCRMEYFIDGNKSEKGDYLLSPKELCNLPYVGQLIEAGVDSFKIEGRMKRAEYTAFVTSMFRKYVDLYFELGKEKYADYLLEHNSEWKEDLRKLMELYNRDGFTQGYLQAEIGDSSQKHPGKRGQMLAQMRPKHNGVCVGEVLTVNKHEVIYKATQEISAQDVVEFRNQKLVPSYEYTLGDAVRKGQHVTARYLKGSKIHVGDKVYRTKDAKLLTEIRDEYIDQKQQIGLDGFFEAKLGENLCLSVSRGDITVSCLGEVCQAANTPQSSYDSVKKALNQTGNSTFYFESLSTQIGKNLFLPVGAVKKLRRQAFEELERKIVEQYIRNDSLAYEEMFDDQSNEEYDKKTSYAASVMNRSQLGAVLQDAKISTVYLHTEEMSVEEMKQAFKETREAKKDICLVMPAVFRQGIWQQFEKMLKEKDNIFSLEFSGYLVKNFESLHFLKDIVRVSKEKIRLDANMYMMNPEAYRFWREQGISKYTVPLEATRYEMEQFSYLSQMELVIYGKMPLMVSAQCITANTKGCMSENSNKRNQSIYVTDARERVFEAVNYCKYCYNIIYQNEPVYLLDEVLHNSTFAHMSFRYCFTTENEQEVRDILAGRFASSTQSGHFQTGIE